MRTSFALPPAARCDSVWHMVPALWGSLTSHFARSKRWRVRSHLGPWNHRSNWVVAGNFSLMPVGFDQCGLHPIVESGSRWGGSNLCRRGHAGQSDSLSSECAGTHWRVVGCTLFGASWCPQGVHWTHEGESCKARCFRRYDCDTRDKISWISWDTVRTSSDLPPAARRDSVWHPVASALGVSDLPFRALLVKAFMSSLWVMESHIQLGCCWKLLLAASGGFCHCGLYLFVESGSRRGGNILGIKYGVVGRSCLPGTWV